MNKPSFPNALAQETSELRLAPKPEKAKDGRINATLRISPEGLEALKNIAAAKLIRVSGAMRPSFH